MRETGIDIRELKFINKSTLLSREALLSQENFK